MLIRWSPTYDVSAILTSIQSLLDEPNPNSPANSLAAQLYLENRYVLTVQQTAWMHGIIYLLRKQVGYDADCSLFGMCASNPCVLKILVFLKSFKSEFGIDRLEYCYS